MASADNDHSLLEAALLAHPAIGDCAIVGRANLCGERRTLAYVVKTGPVANGELRAHLAGASSLDVQVVPVSAIPLTPDGGVDERRLASLDLADSALAVQWADQVKELPGVTDAVAFVQEIRPARSLALHLADVLPNLVERASNRHDLGHPAAARHSDGAWSDVPAVCDGGPLHVPDAAPRLLGDTLIGAARLDPAHGIAYVEADGADVFQTYGSLLDDATRVMSGLRDRALHAGARVVLQLASPREFITAFWGCVLAGCVPVPLAAASSYDKPSAPMQSLAGVWALLGRPPVIATRGVADELERAARRLRLEDIRVLALEDLRQASADAHPHTGTPDDLALLMLTSGSTGAPKAVALTHRNLLCRSMASAQLNGFSATDVSLNWMPLDHVAGLIYFHLRDVYLGCRQVQLPTGVVLQDPLRWLDELDRHRATTTFAPNFAYALVNDQERRLESRRLDLASVRSVLNGAEAIVARTARRFLTLLEPHGLAADAMKPVWGMSETSSGVTYNDRFSRANSSDDDEFVDVGRPVPGTSIRIVDADGDVVPEGVVGRVQIRGVTVTCGYFGSPDATAAAFTPDGWFKTGDLGTITDGRLTITGREKDVVIINSVNYYCHAIESVVETLEDVEPAYTAACAVRRHDADTDSLAIFFHPRDESCDGLGDLLRRIRQAVTARFGIGPEYLLPVPREAVPKTSLGKIQRSDLGRRLMAGEFDDTLKLVERVTEGPNTIPDWFFRKVWRPGRPVTGGAGLEDATALIFMDRRGLGVDLRRALVAAGATCVTVEASDTDTFKATDRHACAIDPTRDEAYAALFDHLRRHHIELSHLVHLWGCGTDDPVRADVQELGALSALRVVRNLEPPDGTRAVRMLFVGTQVQRVGGGESIDCEKATILGLLKSIPQELPWLQCRHLDVTSADRRIVPQIVDEMVTSRSEREVAYRDGTRFVSCLEKAAFPSGPSKPPAIHPEGFYLITGGAGGMGRLIAGHLREHFGTRLLLTGRSEPAGDPARCLGTLSPGGEAAYEQVDICDADRMARLVGEYEDRWNRRLRGVFHLAGAYRERLVKEESADSFVALLRPKALGTRVAHGLLAERGGGLLVCASSLAGFFGGAMMGAYSAASAFQDAFAEQHDGRDGVECLSLAWSNWEGIGQSGALENRGLPRSRGYSPIPPRQALRSLLVAMSRRDPTLIIGLDGNHPHIQRYRGDTAAAVERVRVYYARPQGPVPRVALSSLTLRDEFGAPSRPAFVPLADMPRTPSGAVAVDELMGLADGGDRAAPRTEPEKRLAEIWKRVLAVPSVSLADNFFDLGGDSLVASRVLGDIREQFGVDVTLRQLFDAATLGDLVRTVEGARPCASGRLAPAVDVHLGQLLERLEDLGDDEVDRLLREIDEKRVVGG